MVKTGWRRCRGSFAEFHAAISFAFVLSASCGGVEADTANDPPLASPRDPAATKSDSSSTYIDSPYQTGVSQGTASVAQIPATLHMTPASLSFIVDREWAATGVSATLKIVNGTSAPATLDHFEIEEAGGRPAGGARLFTLPNAPPPITLAPGETYRLDVTFKTDQLASVAARLVVKSLQATNGELEAALWGKVTSF